MTGSDACSVFSMCVLFLPFYMPYNFFFIIKHDVNETYVNKPLEIW